MKSFVITIENNKVSESAANNCIASSEKVDNPFTIEKFNAIIPKQVDGLMSRYNLKWNYPWQGEEFDFGTGLKKSAYKTAEPKKRIACALSHYLLWKQSSDKNEHLLILEHDAIFTDRLDPHYIIASRFNAVGLNNPLGATRKSQVFHESIQAERERSIIAIPTIDEISIPQGLAGNSAYIISPDGARVMLDLAHQYGLWPNDALMCKQLVPRLGVTTKYYTKVQGTQSTTVN
jgi:GR25 family glycosyltransferase involved in LPS biosynthesis